MCEVGCMLAACPNRRILLLQKRRGLEHWRLETSRPVGSLYLHLYFSCSSWKGLSCVRIEPLVVFYLLFSVAFNTPTQHLKGLDITPEMRSQLDDLGKRALVQAVFGFGGNGGGEQM